MTTTIEGFTSVEVSRISGVTYRRLDYWDRSDALKPSLSGAEGSGSRRHYSEADACVAIVLRTITDVMGEQTTERLKAMATDIRTMLTSKPKPAVVYVHFAYGDLFVTHGKPVRAGVPHLVIYPSFPEDFHAAAATQEEAGTPD